MDEPLTSKILLGHCTLDKVYINSGTHFVHLTIFGLELQIVTDLLFPENQ